MIPKDTQIVMGSPFMMLEFSVKNTAVTADQIREIIEGQVEMLDLSV